MNWDKGLSQLDNLARVYGFAITMMKHYALTKLMRSPI